MIEINEIKLNSYFSTYSTAKYEDEKDKKSIPIINHRMLRTDKLFEKIKDNVNVQASGYKVNHLFPPNCRYYEEYKEGHIIVIEEPPAFRTIKVNKDMSNEIESLKSSGKLEEYGYENWEAENPKRPYQFYLALPYTIFVLTFSKTFDMLGGCMFFRTQPISGFSDPLCKSPFLNVNDSQNICFGERIYKGPKRSIFADTQFAIGVFWGAEFNADYISNYLLYNNVAGLCDYLTWEYYSQTDPMFVYNADWLKYEENIGQIVNRVRGWVLKNENDEEKNLNYHMLENLFNTPHEIGLAQIPGLDVKQPLIYDVSQYIFLGDDPLYIGDSFKSKGRRYYIDSFLGFRKMVNPSYVNIQREDGRLFKMRLTENVKDYIKEKIREEKYETQAILPNGVVLKPGDIFVMKNIYEHDVYRKIHYLRKNPEGILEGRFGSEFYIIDNLPKESSILDLSNPDYNGIKLEVDKEYFVLRGSRHPNGPVLNLAYAKFKEITSGNGTNLVSKFYESRGDNDGYSYNIDFTGGRRQDEHRIFCIENTRPLPTVFRMGRRIVYVRKRNRYNTEESSGFVIPGLGVGILRDGSLRDAHYSDYRDQFIKDDTFKIESWDMDIEFKIGEKVVVADWKNPINMLIVKQIEGFVENRENGDISFTLSDKNGNLTNEIYIKSSSSAVRVGSIRKITNKWEDLTAGMKIVSKQSGISMFPKKDSNIIIGFLYDTGGPEPLVLCSNACTLWYSDVIEKFDIIPMTNIKWKELNHAPINPSKMRFQAGDLIDGSNYFRSTLGYMAYKPRDSRTVRAQQLRYYPDYLESYAFDRRFTRDVIFDCFPNPRLTGTQEGELGFVNAFPNFHGMYTTTGGYHSSYLFPNEPRSLLNVPNNTE